MNLNIFLTNTNYIFFHFANRWAILCYKWNSSVRRVLTASLNDPVTEKADDSYSTLIQLTAWGLPTLLTVAVLVARLVDADELLGEYLWLCFIIWWSSDTYGQASFHFMTQSYILSYFICTYEYERCNKL